MPNNTRKTILLVEDEAILAMSEALLIRKMGYEVVTAYNGESAIDLACAATGSANRAIDLILMDIDLGRGMDGTQAARQILRQRNLPIIFLTNHSEREMVEKVHDITRYGYVIKNSGNFVLQSSIEMAFELFEAHRLSRQSELKFQTVADFTYAWEYWLSPEGYFIYVSPACERITGYPPQAFIEDPSLLLNILHPEDQGRFSHHVSYASGTHSGPREELEFRLRTREGKERWISHICQPVHSPEGQYLGIRGSNRDITEQKQIEQARSLAEEKFYRAFHISPDSININRLRDGLYVDVNQGFCTLTGYAPEEVIGRTSLDINIWADPTDRDRLVQGLREHGEVVNLEAIFQGKGDRRKTCLMSARVIEIDGEAHILSITRDISQRKAAERAQSLQAELLNVIFDHAPYTMMVVDGEAKIEKINQSGIGLMGGGRAGDQPGLRAGQALGCINARCEGGCGLSSACSTCALRSAILHTLKTGQTLYNQAGQMQIQRGQEIIDLDLLVSTTLMKTQDQVRVLASLVDITDNQRLRASLIESEERYRVLIEASPIPIVVLQHNRCMMANPAAEYALGYGTGELVGTTAPEIVLPADQETISWREANLGTNRVNPPVEISLVRRNGQVIPIESLSVRVKLDGKPAMLILFQDITQRKADQARLKAALVDKETLLKETHHRVKNNLATIVSLLALQANGLKDASARQALADTQQRVFLMAMIHEDLYRSADLEQINFGEYLQRLVERVTGLYDSPDNLQVVVEVEEIFLTLERALPLGQLVNELLTNTFKHAFPGGRAGSLQVRLAQIGDQICLTVADDGVGLPPGLDPQATSTLGLQLVWLLMRQLNGTLEVKSSPGCQFQVCLPAEGRTL